MPSNRGFSRRAGRAVQRVCHHGEASWISEAVRRAAFSSEWNTSAALFNVLPPPTRKRHCENEFEKPTSRQRPYAAGKPQSFIGDSPYDRIVVLGRSIGKY